MFGFVLWAASIVVAICLWDHYDMEVTYLRGKGLEGWSHWGVQQNDENYWMARIGPVLVDRIKPPRSPKGD